MGQILEEALKSPYCQAPVHNCERQAMASFLPWLGRSSFHGSSLEFHLVQAPADFQINGPLHQIVSETFREGGGPESLSAEEPPRIGMEPVRGPAVRF